MLYFWSDMQIVTLWNVASIIKHMYVYSWRLICNHQRRKIGTYLRRHWQQIPVEIRHGCSVCLYAFLSVWVSVSTYVQILAPWSKKHELLERWTPRDRSSETCSEFSHAVTLREWMTGSTGKWKAGFCSLWQLMTLRMEGVGGVGGAGGGQGVEESQDAGG